MAVLKAVGTFSQHYLTASPLPRKLADSRAPVAQLDRASDYGSEGLKFESSRARVIRAVFVSAFAQKIGPGLRRFDKCQKQAGFQAASGLSNPPVVLKN